MESAADVMVPMQQFAALATLKTNQINDLLHGKTVKCGKWRLVAQFRKLPLEQQHTILGQLGVYVLLKTKSLEDYTSEEGSDDGESSSATSSSSASSSSSSDSDGEDEGHVGGDIPEVPKDEKKVDSPHTRFLPDDLRVIRGTLVKECRLSREMKAPIVTVNFGTARSKATSIKRWTPGSDSGEVLKAIAWHESGRA